MTIEVSDQEVLDRYPQTRIDHDNKSFYKGWLQRRLVMNRCAECSRWHHPPKPICPECWSDRVDPVEVTGRGVVHLLIRVHQGSPTPEVDYEGGWPVATVDLEEQQGLRFTSTVIGVDRAMLRIGLPVELTWIDRYDAPFPVFRPRSV